MEKQKVVDAVNFLIQSENYARLIREITNIIERWDTYPMVYAGDLAVLNAMIDVGTQSRDAFERLVKLIENKRKLLPDTKRADYQRELMAKRRARINKAIELQELVTKRKLSAAEKKTHAEEAQARWKKARDEFIAGKGDLSWKERNEQANMFWEMIDRQLDTNIKQERAKKR